MRHHNTGGRVGGALGLVYLAILTGALLGANGYSFGLGDHAIHLPWLLRAMDPAFLQGDLVVEAARHHPSLFWWLQAAAVRFVPVEALYGVVHVASIAAMLGGTRALARAVHPEPAAAWAGLVAPLLVVFAHGTLASIPTLDDHVLNRTVALGPLLYALALGARGRYRHGSGLRVRGSLHAAFAVVGLAFLVHPTTACHAAALLAVHAAASGREARRALLTAPLVGLACASPLVVLMLVGRSAGGVPWPPPDVWVENTITTTWFHHWPSLWTWRQWNRAGPPLLLLAAALIHRRSRVVLAYAAGVAALFAAGWALVEGLRLPSALHLHLLESTRFLSFVAAAHGAGWIVERWSAHPPSLRSRAGVALAAAGFGLDGAFDARTTPGVTLAYLLPSGVILAGVLLDLGARAGAPRLAPPPPWAAPAAAAAMAALAAALPLLGLRTRAVTWRFEDAFRQPDACDEHPLARTDAARPPGRALCGIDLMGWAARSLPPGAVVAVPPYFLHPIVAFRHGARRAALATFKDGSEGSFSVPFAAAWTAQVGQLSGRPDLLGVPLETLSRGTIRQARADLLAGYRDADAARFQEAARRFGATHAVVESGARAPDLPLVYEDAFYRVYRIDAPP